MFNKVLFIKYENLPEIYFYNLKLFLKYSTVTLFFLHFILIVIILYNFCKNSKSMCDKNKQLSLKEQKGFQIIYRVILYTIFIRI